MHSQAVGTVALVGSGEFLPTMAGVDRTLIATLGGEARVAIVPTAASPDGEAVFDRWLRLGVEHFARLGCRPIPVPIHTRADAGLARHVDALHEANFVYLSGGKPAYLHETLRDTEAWRAIAAVYQSGGVVAGCSAGAMVLGELWLCLRRTAPPSPALGLLPGIAVVPHFDEMPAFVYDALAGIVGTLPGITVVGIDGSTALIGTAGRWTVGGRSGVTVFAASGRRQYRSGDDVPLPASLGS